MQNSLLSQLIDIVDSNHILFDLKFNKNARRVVCVCHGVVVGFARVAPSSIRLTRNHFLTHHCRNKSLAQPSEKEWDSYHSSLSFVVKQVEHADPSPVVDYSATLSNYLLPIIHGLTVWPGVRCEHCPKYFLYDSTDRTRFKNNVKIIKRHYKSDHTASLLDLAGLTKVFVQRLSSAGSSPYFGVSQPQGVDNEMERDLLYIKNQLHQDILEDSNQAARIDNSSPSYAMSVLKWDVYAARIENFAEIALRVAKADFGVEGEIGKIGLGFSETLIPEIMNQFMILIGSLSDESVFLRKLVMGSYTKQAVDAVSENGRVFSLVTKPTLIGYSYYLIPRYAKVWLQFLTHLYYMFVYKKYRIFPLIDCIKELEAFFVNKPSLDTLLDLLKALFIQKASLQSKDLEFPCVSFLVAMSLKPTRVFDLERPKALCSPIKYLIRVIFLLEMNKNGNSDDYILMLAELLVKDGTVCSPMTVMLSLASQFERLSSFTPIPKILWNSESGKLYDLSCGGFRLDLSSLRNAALNLANKANILLEELLCGMPIGKEYENFLCDYPQDSDCSTVGYGIHTFVTDKLKSRLPTILEDGIGRSKQLAHVWSLSLRTCVINHQATSARFQQILFTLIQVTMGPVARSTESCDLLLVNTQSRARSVVILGGTIVLLYTVGATNKNLLQRDGVIGRPLPLMVAKILFYYVLFVRPFEILIADEEWRTLLRTNLYVLNGRPVEPQLVRATFPRLMDQIGKVGMWNISSFRHAVKAILVAMGHSLENDISLDYCGGFGHFKSAG
jgi:hypothetical protein